MVRISTHIWFAFLLVAVMLLLHACTAPAPEAERLRQKAAGNAVYGGLFRMNFTDEIRSVFPHNTVDASAFNLMNQVYEGLVRVDRITKEVKPVLAERYEVSADGRTYRFFLRKDVYFHDDPIFGEAKTRQVKAEDVALCYRKLCEPSEYNELYDYAIDVIKGGRAHYEKGAAAASEARGPEGIKVISEFVLELELEFPMPNFLAVLGHPCFWVFPKELYNYGREIDNWSIGTGPFKARTIKPNDVIILERNHQYWASDEEGNQLPYLDAIRCNFLSSEQGQLRNFLQGNLDLVVQVPHAEATAFAREDSAGTSHFKVLTSPGLRVEYYGFQHRSEVFGNPFVRKAINYAIDREYLVREVLNGYGTPANRGFVPDVMPGFDQRDNEGFYYNPDTARALLAQAGFPNAEGFPVLTLQLNDGNATALSIAEEVQAMLSENLNFTVELAVLPRKRHYDQVERGNVGFWRDGWIADYPDPENFLKLFHGKLVPDDSVKASYLNTVRFKNDDFDAAFEAALREPNRERRTALFLQADREIMKHAAVAPLYYEKWIWLASQRVHNLAIGTMGELDLSTVYISQPKQQS